MRRREFLRTGLAGSRAFRCPSCTPRGAGRGDSSGQGTALIVVWLQGGASHLETYDPKPDAPAEVRGPFGVDRDAGGGRAHQRAAAEARRGRRQVRDPALAVPHGVLPPAGEPADVHGPPGAGAQAPARAPRPDVRREPAAVDIRAGGCRPMWASTRSRTSARPTSARRPGRSPSMATRTLRLPGRRSSASGSRRRSPASAAA